jgi:hypothetical protein
MSKIALQSKQCKNIFPSPSHIKTTCLQLEALGATLKFYSLILIVKVICLALIAVTNAVTDEVYGGRQA